MSSRAFAVVVVTVSVAGCGELDPPSVRTESGALEAFCSASVRGTGVVDVETDYIPRVVACENGSADFEALRAQAISARSYLYYKLETAGDVADGTSDQVYSCSREPTMEHYEAARTTAGEVLTYNGNVIAAFFVAGAIPTTMDCVPAAGDRDPTDTEKWVTYNLGRSGDGVVQTPLGWVNPANYRNRGCKSQNGANCLSRAGWGYRDILEFYYGNDIVHEVAAGPCIAMPVEEKWCAVASAGETIVDEAGECFSSTCAGGDCVGRWRIDVAEAGDYAIFAQAGGTYRVVHSGVEDAVLVEQSEDWSPLGTYRFAAGPDQWIELSSAVFDAIRIRRVVPDAPPQPPREPEIPTYGGEDDPQLPEPESPAAQAGGCTCVRSVRNERSALVALLGLLFSYSCAQRRRLSRTPCASPSRCSSSSPPARRTTS